MRGSRGSSKRLSRVVLQSLLRQETGAAGALRLFRTFPEFCRVLRQVREETNAWRSILHSPNLRGLSKCFSFGTAAAARPLRTYIDSQALVDQTGWPLEKE